MCLPDYEEAWAMKPRRLTSTEIEFPEKVLSDFFQYAHLPQVRWYLWELMKTTITGGYPQLKPRERSNLLYFYEQLEKVIEIVHVLHERNTAGQKN